MANKGKEKGIDTDVRPEKVTNADIIEAFNTTKPSAMLKVAVYEKWMKNFGSI